MTQNPGSSKPDLESELSPQIKKLLEYQRQGYVFHGSENPDIAVLEPRPAADSDVTNTFNNDNAVFAAPVFIGALIFACTYLSGPEAKAMLDANRGKQRGWSFGYDDDGTVFAQIPKEWEPFLRGNKGYVYVLDGRGLSDAEYKVADGQVKFMNPVKPKDVVEVKFEDFEKLGGEVRWYE